MRSAVNFSGFCAAAKAVGTECLERALGESFRGRVSRGEPLSRHTSYRIGGPADLFLEPVDRESLILAVRRARELGIPPLVIGFGTNLLVSDRGFRGVVISTKRALLGIRFEGTEAVAGAGEGIARLARACARRGMAGLEGLGGVPGSVGGAIVMNAGAFGCEIAGCLKAAEVLHGEGSIATVSADQLGLGYRTSKLSKAAVILSARFELGEGDPKQLVRRLWELEIIRRRSQPVGLPSAGCVFRNPPGNSAGRLIEAAGAKGLREGGAKVSEKHGNFIVNLGDATAEDVRRLIERVSQLVAERFGVELELEVQIVGELE